MVNIILIVLYIIVGYYVMNAYWEDRFKKEYEAAKTSKEGVEEGMVSLVLLCIVFFWPLIFLYKGIKYYKKNLGF